VGFSDQVTRLFGSTQPLVSMGRNLGLLGLDLLPPAKRWFARQAMGLGASRCLRLTQQGKARLMRWFMATRRTWAGHRVRTSAMTRSRCAWAELVQPQLRRHPVRRQPVFDGRPVLHVDADGEPGRDYIVWDKAASIDFIAPGKGPVYAVSIDDALLDEIRRRPQAARSTCRNCRSIFTTVRHLVARVEKPFTCGASRKRDRLKAWKCAQIC
jgi:hypothetical protein